MDSKSQSNLWTVQQAIITATICFAVGVAIGYIGHGPNVARANAPARVAVSAPAEAVGPQAIAPPISNPNPSPEQLMAASKQAAMPLQEQLKKHPKDFTLLVQAGEMYYHHGAFADAASFYKRALDVKDDPAIRNQYASTFYYQGDADGALKQYNLVLEKDAKNAIALLNTGMIRYKAKKDPKGAIESWQSFLKNYPNDPRGAKVQTLIEEASKAKA
jgi:cytochrome c-type biogenesis protein CcmH/NrfG